MHVFFLNIPHFNFFLFLFLTYIYWNFSERVYNEIYMYASIINEKKRYDTKTRLTQQCKRNLTLNWRIHASFTQRVLHVCIAIQRDAHRTRYTQWAVECTVHAEESQICEKYAVYPRRRIVRNITADSSELHAAERDNIPIFFQTKT